MGIPKSLGGVSLVEFDDLFGSCKLDISSGWNFDLGFTACEEGKVSRS